ncbi:DUF3653 domain-containing protein [Vibrio sonorensis]|uniref:DUF3653 domain-containing protein n=1 Tax=Vibrio sonorensis TaxID=1004316 RepID=UPI0009FCF6EA|nr:DUF3653 domain-containing protein [Vibrio sonorensis]
MIKITTIQEVIRDEFQGSYLKLAEFLHVNERTVRRWLRGESRVNPCAEKLLYVVARGYLPPDIRFDGYRVCMRRTAIITPSGREFGIGELESWVYMKDQYYALIDKYGPIENPPRHRARVLSNPFRGNRRSKDVAWIPSRDCGYRAMFRCK